MKSGEKLPALFVNVLTDPPIKPHHILDSRAVVYSCQFQCHLMHFSLVRVKVVVSWVLVPWYQCPTTFTLLIIMQFFIWFCSVVGLLQFKLVFSMPSVCLRYCQTDASTSESLRENCLCIISWWTFSFWSACIPPREGEKAWNLAGGGLWSRNILFAVSRKICPNLAKLQAFEKWFVDCWQQRNLTARSMSPHGSKGWTHIPCDRGTGYAGVIVGLSGCFLPFFSAHHAPLHLLTLRHWRRGMCGGESQRDLEWRREGNGKLAEGWEKPAGRRRQAWDSDRLKRMGKKETNLERLRQKAAALEQALLQCWEEISKLFILPFFCYQLWSAKHTGQTSAYQQHELLEDATTCYCFLPAPHSSGLDGRARGCTRLGQRGQRVL